MTSGLEQSDAFVFFGATGDLAHKKIFPALYALAKRGELNCPVVCIAFSNWTLEQLRARVTDSVEHSTAGLDDRDGLDRLLAAISYVDGDYQSTSTFNMLKSALGQARHPVHYLAIPPELFGTVVTSLGSSGLAEGGRVIIEKPFGRDLASARQLNAIVTSIFPESSIFRIDHFLGKEAIENIVYFRLANSFLEPIWNRNYVARVEITLAESFGVEGRGRFYESVGCLRDVVQNHLLQVVSLLAMEPPVSLAADSLRDEKVKVLQAIRPLASTDLVRGQFVGYRSEPGVAPDSEVETYCALRLSIDSWRWSGVPWYLRSGKCLAETAAEVLVEFRPPPSRVFPDSIPQSGRSNYIRFRLEPGPAIALAARVKRAGKDFVGDQRELYLLDEQPGEQPPYERLLGDALAGDRTLFARQDAVEAAWAVVDPVLKDHGPTFAYQPGSWGPKQADDLISQAGGWHKPVVAGAEPNES